MDRRSKTSRPEPRSIRQRTKHDSAAIPLKPLPPSLCLECFSFWYRAEALKSSFWRSQNLSILFVAPLRFQDTSFNPLMQLDMWDLLSHGAAHKA